jgi:hypothetical protein
VEESTLHRFASPQLICCADHLHLLACVQHLAELHIVSLIAEGEAKEWGCDDVWAGGKPNFANCTAVFGITYKMGKESAPGVHEMFKEAPSVVGKNFSTKFSMKELDMNTLLPDEKSYFGYYGSLVCPRKCFMLVSGSVHMKYAS